MLHVQSFTFNALREHTYVIYDDTRAAAIIDPGCYIQLEREALSTFIAQKGLQVGEAKLSKRLETHIENYSTIKPHNQHRH